MDINRRIPFRAIVLAGFLLLMSWLVSIRLMATSTQVLSSTLATMPESREAWLIDRALDSALSTGLVSRGSRVADRAMVEIAQYVTLAEWDSIANSKPMPSPEQLRLYKTKPLFVVVIRGEFREDRMPGGASPYLVKGAVYDNRYVFIEAASGHITRTSSFGAGYLLPLYPENTIAGGATAVYQLQPEATTEMLPLPSTPAP